MAKSSAQLDREIRQAVRRSGAAGPFAPGDRVKARGVPKSSPEYDVGTVESVSGRGGSLVRVRWDRAGEAYNEDAASLEPARGARVKAASVASADPPRPFPVYVVDNFTGRKVREATRGDLIGAYYYAHPQRFRYSNRGDEGSLVRIKDGKRVPVELKELEDFVPNE